MAPSHFQAREQRVRIFAAVSWCYLLSENGGRRCVQATALEVLGGHSQEAPTRKMVVDDGVGVFSAEAYPGGLEHGVGSLPRTVDPPGR